MSYSAVGLVLDAYFWRRNLVEISTVILTSGAWSCSAFQSSSHSLSFFNVLLCLPHLCICIAVDWYLGEGDFVPISLNVFNYPIAWYNTLKEVR